MYTNWNVILILNTAMYAALSFGILLMVCGTFFCPYWICGLILASLTGGMGSIASIVVTGVFRYSEEGEMCAK